MLRVAALFGGFLGGLQEIFQWIVLRDAEKIVLMCFPQVKSYVQADLDVYEFFKSQGTIIVNDAADFTGMNGCYLYQGRDVKPSKKNDLKDQMLVLAPHEGIVPSDIWLTCRKKLMNNMKIQSARKATHTWLAGKIKCGNCGYALMSIFNPSGK